MLDKQKALTAMDPARLSDPQPGSATELEPEVPTRQQENLVSFIVVGTGNPEIDAIEARNLASFAFSNFDYYEILVLSSAPTTEWRETMLQLGSETPNTRVISIETPMNYEELAANAIGHAIGDYIVSVQPGEIDTSDVSLILERLVSGQTDIVKAVHVHSKTSLLERLLVRTMGWIILAISGRRIQGFQARALGLSRAAVSRISSLDRAGRLFRILDLSGYLKEESVTIAAPPRRRFFGRLGDRARLASELLSLSATRLIRAFAIICFSLAMLSLAVIVISVLIWTMKTDIAQGWTSQVVILSIFFAANFGVLAAICLGIYRVLRSSEPDMLDAVTTEISGGDFFQHDSRLNVETSDQDS